MSWTRRHLLQASLGVGALGWGARRAAAATPGASRLIMVYLNGAWDPTYHIDPKLDSPHVDGPEAAPPVSRPEHEAIETIEGHRLAINAVSRPTVPAFFERWGDQVVSLTGVTIGGIAHNPNRTRILTGTADRRRPDLVTWLGSQESVAEPMGALDLSGWGLQGSHGADATRAGYTWQLRQLLAGSDGLGAVLPRDPVQDDLVEDYLRRRAARAADPPLAQWSQALARSVSRLEGMRDHAAELQAIFDRDPSQPTSHVEVAADLVSAGLAKSVLVDPRMYFDTHVNNVEQGRLCNDLFAVLDRLLSVLSDHGTLDDTLVVVCSEMTRSPKLVGGGKDHWPLAAYLFAGGGIVGGRQLGGTDELQAPRPADRQTGAPRSSGEPIDYTEVHAGLAQHLGLDAEEHLPGVMPFGGLTG